MSLYTVHICQSSLNTTHWRKGVRCILHIVIHSVDCDKLEDMNIEWVFYTYFTSLSGRMKTTAVPMPYKKLPVPLFQFSGGHFSSFLEDSFHWRTVFQPRQFSSGQFSASSPLQSHYPEAAISLNKQHSQDINLLARD